MDRFVYAEMDKEQLVEGVSTMLRVAKMIIASHSMVEKLKGGN